MAQDTGKFRTNEKDQFYTKASVAKTCVDSILNLCPDEYQWIEPSAGNGVFLRCVEGDKVGIDIEPKADDILRGDFLEWQPTSEKKRIVFGNPPFGRQGSLAKSFIKHAAIFADIIAFILPRSFVKPSMARAFPAHFHCLHTAELEKNSFEVNGKPYDVPCVFQIWQRQPSPRTPITRVQAIGFEYVKTGIYHIAFRRVGGLAGKAYASAQGFSPQSHYFWKLDEQYVGHTKNILDALNRHTFPTNTTGPRSLSKCEANTVMNRILYSEHAAQRDAHRQ